MMKFLIAALLVSCTGPSFRLSDRMSMKVESPLTIGTAWPITEDSYLTAWHCIIGWNPEDILVNGTAIESYTRVAEQDAVILHMAEPHGYPPFPIDARRLLPGERVYKSGWGQGLHWWTEGFATNDQDRLSLPICPGDSGGPVFDNDGEVIGIILVRGMASHHCWIVTMATLDL